MDKVQKSSNPKYNTHHQNSSELIWEIGIYTLFSAYISL
jgi:hypothetical protein